LSLLVILRPQVVSFAEPDQLYPTKDSGIPASEADVMWLDNDRVLFHAYDGYLQL
jgi:hypothetical protein